MSLRPKCKNHFNTTSDTMIFWSKLNKTAYFGYYHENGNFYGKPVNSFISTSERKIPFSAVHLWRYANEICNNILEFEELKSC